MAYIPPYDPRRLQSLATSGGAGSAAPGVSSTGSTPPPASDGGQKFGALRSFFSANQPQADAQAGSVLAPLATEGQQALDYAGQASRTTENYGGNDAVDKSIAARDSALTKAQALGTPSGIAASLGEGKDATYTEGQRSADAALFGRTSVPGEANRWAGVLGALNPTTNPDLKSSEPKLNPVTPAPHDAGLPQGNYEGQPVTRVNPETGRKEKYDPYSGEWSPIQDRPGEG